MFKPIGTKIVVKEPALEEVTSAGLYVQGGTGEQMICEVVAVGDGEYTETGSLIALRIVVGDKVLLQRGYGQKLTYEGEDYTIVTEPEVIGIV